MSAPSTTTISASRFSRANASATASPRPSADPEFLLTMTVKVLTDVSRYSQSSRLASRAPRSAI
jgi:hypothetical protein